MNPIVNNNNANVAKGFATIAGEGERIGFVADTLTLKATAVSTGKSFTVVECLTAPGGGPPPHIHTSEDEFWYVLTGLSKFISVMRCMPSGQAGSRISSASPVSQQSMTAPHLRSMRPKSHA